jgi:acyl carrier protein
MSFEQLFADVFGFPQELVKDELGFREVPRWDSLAHMMLIARIEDTYEMQFTGDEIADMKSVGDLRKSLRAHGVTV